jgi:hypothetical protein
MVIAKEKPTIATVAKTLVTLEEYQAIAEKLINSNQSNCA